MQPLIWAWLSKCPPRRDLLLLQESFRAITGTNSHSFFEGYWCFLLSNNNYPLQVSKPGKHSNPKNWLIHNIVFLFLSQSHPFWRSNLLVLTCLCLWHPTNHQLMCFGPKWVLVSLFFKSKASTNQCFYNISWEFLKYSYIMSNIFLVLISVILNFL